MNLLFICIVVCIFTADAYPQWFNEYKDTHRKLYTVEEERKAYEIIAPKYHFAKKHGYSLNHRADINHTKNVYFRKVKPIRKDPVGNHRLGLPLTMDWRTHGAVTKPKNQGSCGGCYAFAAAGAFEYWYWKKTGKLKDFSVQQWLDCSKPKNFGCDGGVMGPVFEKAHVKPAGTEQFDPYLHRNSKCKTPKHKPWLYVDTYAVQSDEWRYPIESHLQHNLVQYGPIPVGIDSSSWHLQLYESGILKASHCGKDIDHAVLVVGFTPTYWIIKNSWGTAWGQDGYFYLERGKNACGINSYASFITSAHS